LSVWINGRRCSTLSYRDRGLQYGDGVFESMRVQRRRVRLLDFHLDRLYRELGRVSAGRSHEHLNIFEAEIEPSIRLGRRHASLGFSILAQL